VPTYQYACTVCDHRFEQVQAFSDPSLTVCPECSGKLRKLYGSVGVVFKGSGFYRTDSRSAGKSTSTPAAGSDTKSSDTKSESKPAGTPKTDSASSSSTKSESTAKAS
jgi:putative FmdB family regulatory protein